MALAQRRHLRQGENSYAAEGLQRRYCHQVHQGTFIFYQVPLYLTTLERRSHRVHSQVITPHLVACTAGPYQ